MKTNINYINLFLYIIIFILGRCSISSTVEIVNKEVTIVDTITIKDIKIDTVFNTKYIERYLAKVDTIINTKTDTLTIKDSVKVYIPINTYIAEEPNLYRIEAEGYDVKFNSIEVYPKTVLKTESIITKKPSNISIGIQAGYGYTIQGFTPYIGVGVQYNIFNFLIK